MTSKAHPTPLIETMARAMAARELPGTPMWDELAGWKRALTREMVEYALKAADDAGFVLVPKEPTSEMVAAWWPLIYSQTDAAGFKSGWAQMIAVVQRDRSDT